MGQLVDLLQSTEEYQSYHPFVQRTFTKMAGAFDDHPDYLTFSTLELVAIYADTKHEQWRDFLQLPVVDRHIRSVLKFDSQIAFRKAHKSLTTEAANGNTAAAKQITDISQILQQEANNRVVVLTHVPRTFNAKEVKHTNDRPTPDAPINPRYTPNFSTDDPAAPIPAVLTNYEPTTVIDQPAEGDF